MPEKASPPGLSAKLLLRRSLRTRVTLYTLAMFVVSLWALSFYASRMLRDDMQSVLGEQQSLTASLLAAEINQELEVRITEV
jgi:hypothetical protein